MLTKQNTELHNWGVSGVGIDEEFMFTWCICTGINNCNFLCCCSAVLLFVCGMWKAVSLELFWSNILLCTIDFMLSYNSTYTNSVVFVLLCVEKNNIPQQSFNMVSGSLKKLCCFCVVFVWFWALGTGRSKFDTCLMECFWDILCDVGKFIYASVSSRTC